MVEFVDPTLKSTSLTSSEQTSAAMLKLHDISSAMDLPSLKRKANEYDKAMKQLQDIDVLSGSVGDSQVARVGEVDQTLGSNNSKRGFAKDLKSIVRPWNETAQSWNDDIQTALWRKEERERERSHFISSSAAETVAEK